MFLQYDFVTLVMHKAFVWLWYKCALIVIKLINDS